MGAALIRDTLIIDDNFGAQFQEGPDWPNAVFVGARNCTIATTQPLVAHNLIIAADTLKVSGAFSVLGASQVTILAREIDGPLHLICAGGDGSDGAPGEDGEQGEEITNVRGNRQQLAGAPGGPGGNGTNGQDGGKGVIHYVKAAATPTGESPAGQPGSAGRGGRGGMGHPPGKAGHAGRSGKPGADGSVAVAQVAAEDLWKPIDSAFAKAWSNYRTEVGLYFFRLFDIKSQIIALNEFKTAIQLNQANADAQTLLTRIVQQQTPTGVPRDIDISPDYKDLAADLKADAILVQSAFQAAADVLQNLQVAEGFKDTFISTARQLSDRAGEALDNVKLAQDDVKIADAQVKQLNSQMAELQQQLAALQNPPFDLGSFVVNLGSLVTSILSVSSGIGAIVSIPFAIAAINSTIGDFASNSTGMPGIVDGTSLFFEDMLNAADTAFQGSGKQGQGGGGSQGSGGSQGGSDLNADLPHFDPADFSKIGGGISALINEANIPKFLVNFDTIEQELEGAPSSAQQAQAKQLVSQLATAQKQLLIAQLQQRQAQDRVTAAGRQAKDYAVEAQTAELMLSSWSAETAFLQQAVGVFVDSARALVDAVAEDVFLARRALEIYELDDASSVHFDYGYLHPDIETTSTPLERVIASRNSVGKLTPDILTWDNLFKGLNEAGSSGFDVVHPDVSLSITDPALLAHLAAGGGLKFTIDAASTPPSMFELKVDHLRLNLEGASATNPVMFSIEHSGHWKMRRRGSAPGDRMIEFNLFPHVDVFNCDPATGALNAVIPANPQSSAPGPPFSFWGRGVIADWRIYADPSTTGLDLSKVRALNLTFGCIGFAGQAAAAGNAPITVSASVVPSKPGSAARLPAKPTIAASGSH